LPQRARVIAVSAYAPELQGSAAAHLFFESLSKPVHYDVLRAAVERALATQDDPAGSVGGGAVR
jgi:DNA-binding NtrC family response regulator